MNRGRPPTVWARRGVELAVRSLPHGPRQRYRQEFLADVHGMSRPEQFRHVCGLVAQSCALRSELAATDVRLDRLRSSTRLSRLLLCDTGARHRWERQFTDDGRLYDRCARCGRDEGLFTRSYRAARRDERPR